MKIEDKKTWAAVFTLISVEQIIKITINNYFIEKRFPILPPILYFEPMFNRNYSWIDSMFQLGVSKWIHIIIVAIMSIIIFLFYQFINRQYGSRTMINVMFAFIFSGALCSLIDKIFWNGSLDYVLIEGLFTFDLKDVYINIFIGLVILFSILKNKAIKQLDGNNVLADFTRYILRKS
jgi:Lipoprotein signal peptidase